MRISERQRRVLQALVEAGGDEEFGFLSFKGIANESGLDLARVRAPVRALARKGLARYGRGLWTEDGEPAGSGYAATRQGIEFLEADNG